MHLPFMKETRSKWEKNAQVQIAKEGLKIDATQIYEDFFIGKLHLHPVGFEPRISLFTHSCVWGRNAIYVKTHWHSA